jgi:hypothetical protein
MKADAHRRPASSLERAIALARPDPTSSVAILENALGVAYHWIIYGCVQKYQQNRDLAPRLNRLPRGPGGTAPGSMVVEF